MNPNFHFKEPHTPQELKAIEILRNAKIETDEDYIKLAQLIADEVAADEAPNAPE